MNSDRQTFVNPAGLGHALWMALLVTTSGPAGAEAGPEQTAEPSIVAEGRTAERGRAPAGHRLSQVRAAASDIERAWLVSLQPHRRVSLSGKAAQRISGIVAGCRPGEDLVYTTPPWPETVVEFATGDGARFTFQLVATAIRVDARKPYTPSRDRTTGDRPETTVRDCFIDPDAENRLLHLHRRHLGPSETKEYRPARDPDLPGLLKEQTEVTP